MMMMIACIFGLTKARRGKKQMRSNFIGLNRGKRVVSNFSGSATEGLIVYVRALQNNPDSIIITTLMTRLVMPEMIAHDD